MQSDVARVTKHITISQIVEKSVRLRSAATGLRTVLPHERTLSRRSVICATGLIDIVPLGQFTTLVSVVLGPYYFCNSHCGPRPAMWLDSEISKL